MRAAAAVCVAAFLAAASRDAHAEDTNRVAAATLLFDEGVKALDEGRLAEACEKLQKSQDLAPSGGTLLAIGECQERSEHYASAWVAYRAAAARAAAAGKTEAEAGALDHAAKLEPKLARVTVNVATPRPDLALVRDGTAMTPSELGVAIPLDPGAHEFHALIGGVDRWSQAITLTAGGEATVDVPVLAPPPEPDKPVVLPQPDRGRTQRVVAFAIAGAGAGALIAGGILGGLAVHDNDLTDPLCHGDLCAARGLRLLGTATHEANAATALFIGGAVLIVGSAILYFTAPRAPKRAAFRDNLILRF